MTPEHKPVRADAMRCYAKCGCGERFKGPDFAEALSRHLSKVNHTGTVGHYAPLPGQQYVTNQEELDANYNDPHAGDDDATGWSEPGLALAEPGPDDWRPEFDIQVEYFESMQRNPIRDWSKPIPGLSVSYDNGTIPDQQALTPRETLSRICAELNKSAEDVMTRKNEDYAKADDPFANFRMFGGLGILVRLSDKLARLRQFEERGGGEFSVADESLRDTVVDGINYFKLFYAFKQMEGKR